MSVGGNSAPGGQSAAMAKAIAQIRLKFLDRLDNDLGALSRAISVSQSGPIDGEELADLLMRLHKITGMAQTLGFSHLGASAADVHLKLERSRDTGDMGAGETDTLRSFADDVGKVLAQERTGAGR